MRASSSSTSGSVWRNNSQRSQPPTTVKHESYIRKITTLWNVGFGRLPPPAAASHDLTGLGTAAMLDRIPRASIWWVPKSIPGVFFMATQKRKATDIPVAFFELTLDYTA